MNFNLQKNSTDGFEYFMPSGIFKDMTGMEHTTVLDSGYAYYKHNIFKKIEKSLVGAGFSNCLKFQGLMAVNGNKDTVTSEVMFVSPGNFFMICFKSFYEYESMPDLVQYGIEETEEEAEERRVNIKGPVNGKIVIYTVESMLLVASKLMKKLISKENKKEKSNRELNIICSSSEGLYLRSFKVNKPDVVIEESYNDDFVEVSETVIRRLNSKKDNGIVLLHSAPGCGKTTYLRYLTSQIKDKRLIYLPPDMTSRLADPDFMGFLMGYPDSVLIIEDAENCLQRRDTNGGGGNQAVSNLLNNSDGLLGDALRLQIVCTFNCNINMIDPALMRPGRLIAEYKFLELNAKKTKTLIAKLYGEESEHFVNARSSMTLAEIYNLSNKKFTSSTNQQPQIGFSNRF